MVGHALTERAQISKEGASRPARAVLVPSPDPGTRRALLMRAFASVADSASGSIESYACALKLIETMRLDLARRPGASTDRGVPSSSGDRARPRVDMVSVQGATSEESLSAIEARGGSSHTPGGVLVGNPNFVAKSGPPRSRMPNSGQGPKEARKKKVMGKGVVPARDVHGCL